MPDAFARVATSLRHGDTQKMLTKSNTVFTLEVLLRRYVYGRPLELKRDARIRDAVRARLSGRGRIVRGLSHARRLRDASGIATEVLLIEVVLAARLRRVFPAITFDGAGAGSSSRGPDR